MAGRLEIVGRWRFTPNAGDRGSNPAGGGGVTPSLDEKMAGAGPALPDFVRVR